MKKGTHLDMRVVPHFCATEEVQAMSADNRPMVVLPRMQEPEESGEEHIVALDLLPRVRYRVRLGSDGEASSPTEETLQPYLCFDSGVLVCPEKGSQNAIIVNLSDRVASLHSGNWKTWLHPAVKTIITSQQQQHCWKRSSSPVAASALSHSSA